eukprot:GSMAST32.ASY1.ANO1.46.1 assembled CDS
MMTPPPQLVSPDRDTPATGAQSPTAASISSPTHHDSAVKALEKSGNGGSASSIRREVGVEAVWSLSTAKPGNGVDQLRDDNKKMSIHEISFYLDHKMDESYTPKRISVKAGNTFHDLEEIHLLELEEPNGWITVDLSQENLRTHLLQVAVQAMHQNGRDTHIRQMKVFGPRLSVTKTKHLPEFKTVELSMFSCIR